MADDERCLCGHTRAEHAECEHPFRPSTVETARHAILTDWYTGDFTQEQLRERLDAFAAAVRAERETERAMTYTAGQLCACGHAALLHTATGGGGCVKCACQGYHRIGKDSTETLVEAAVADIWAAEAQGCLAQTHLDALIAAVRAEKLPSVTCINCGHRMEAFFRDGKPLRETEIHDETGTASAAVPVRNLLLGAILDATKPPRDGGKETRISPSDSRIGSTPRRRSIGRQRC